MDRLPDEEVRPALARVLALHLGGAQSVELLMARREDRLTTRQLAQRFGLAEATVRYKLNVAEARLHAAGLWPSAWNDRVLLGAGQPGAVKR